MSRRKRMLQDLEQDFSDHIEEETLDNIARGMSSEEARRTAVRKFGNVTRIKEQTREVWSLVWLERLWQDIRFSLRTLRRSRGFTVVAVITLALGIGASTAVFSLVDAVLLKPLPFPDAGRIVFPWRLPKIGLNMGFDTYPWGRVDFLFFSRESRAFEALGAFVSGSFDLSGSGEPVRVDGLRASAGFFPALGVSPALGRTFNTEEDQPGRDHEVVLGNSLWRSRFGADPDILGHSIALDEIPYTVIGVMPPGFAFPRGNEMPDGFTFASRVQLWIPLALDPRPTIIPNESDELAVVGRLKPGVTIAQAQTDMDIMGKQLESTRRNGQGWFRSKVTPLTRQAAGDTRRPLLLTLAAVGVVLLIVCSNLAGLLLARALNRKREFAVRAACGAKPSRLIRQLLSESIVLAGMGGLLGILLSRAAIYLVRIFGPTSIPRLSEVGLDVRVGIFALGVTMLTGILCGLAPALAAARENLSESLKDSSRRASSSPAAQRTRNSLVVSQIALALVLVIATGLLTRTLYRLLDVDPGFHAAHVLTFQLTLPGSHYPEQARIVPVYQEALRRLRVLPGVQAAGLTETVPLSGATEATAIRFSNGSRANGPALRFANYTMVSPGYFAAVGTPILRGRAFLESDTASSEPVAIVSSALVKKYWPGKDPIGKQIAPAGSKFPMATIVGIAADVKRLSLRESPPPEMYVPYTQKIWPSLLTMNVVLRTTQAPSSVTAGARAAIRSVDPDLPLADVKPLTDIVADSTAAPRFTVLLLGTFGGLAVLLAMLGMYGVVTYSVSQRVQEIGVRMTLGAQRRDVLRLVLGQGVRLAGLGIIAGLAVSFGATRLMSSFLYGIGAADPLTFGSVAFLLTLIVLVACYLPARRAMRIDPMVALRHE